MPALDSVSKAINKRRARAATSGAPIPQHPAPTIAEPEEPKIAHLLHRAEEMAEEGRNPSGWSDDDIDVLAYLFFCGLFLSIHWIGKGLSAEDKELAPTDDEITRFTKPLARIFARHIKIPGGKSGDAKDILAMAMVGAQYGMRTYLIIDERREARKERAEQEKQTTYSAPSTPPPNGTGPVVVGRAAVPQHVREEIESSS